MTTKGDDNVERIVKAVAVMNTEVQCSVPTIAVASLSPSKT